MFGLDTEFLLTLFLPRFFLTEVVLWELRSSSDLTAWYLLGECLSL